MEEPFTLTVEPTPAPVVGEPVSKTLVEVTHDALIVAAADWLRHQGCAVVITDMSHGGEETPDAIGWSGKWSTVIECKASLSDFRADGKKFFRIHPESGMGCYRYFCAMRGTINPAKLPAGWGLIEWDGRKMRRAKKSAHHGENAARNEISLLLSALRRVAKDAPEGISVRCYNYTSSNRATLGVCVPEN